MLPIVHHYTPSTNSNTEEKVEMGCQHGSSTTTPLPRDREFEFGNLKTRTSIFEFEGLSANQELGKADNVFSGPIALLFASNAHITCLLDINIV